MKIRKGFVSNSSSCSFTIYNKTNDVKTIKDFAKETLYFAEQFNEQYSVNPPISSEKFVETAIRCYGNYKVLPHSSSLWMFGDNDNNEVGHVYDYMLREEGESKCFKWKLEEMLR